MVKITNNYERKYLRDQAFMPFGSMMNAFGLANHGKGMATKEFLEASYKIFHKAVEMIEERHTKVQEIETTAEGKQIGEEPKF